MKKSTKGIIGIIGGLALTALGAAALMKKNEVVDEEYECEDDCECAEIECESEIESEE
jgi:hypothetical protein